jgi:CubicO group peptidase (beta-lactamase class C family)
MSSSRSLPLSISAVAFIAMGLLAAQVNDTHITIEQRIQDRLLPPVLIKGQPLSSQTLKLSDRMAELHVPGASVALIRNGKLERAHGFGVTKIGGPAVTSETLFQAASISKPVTAMAVLRLVESGKLDLDRDVNEYLKTWKVPDNEFTAKKKVTLRELLSHTAGVTVHGFAGYASGDLLPTLVQILNGEKPANSPAIRVDVEPGTIWRYSGGGYVIMQQLLEDVTGKPFLQIMRELVLDPLGMKHSTYEQPLPSARMLEAAIPYDRNGVPIANGPHSYPEMAPAGLWTTPSELALYVVEIQNALLGKSNRVLSTTMVHQMLAPGMGEWGLGLQVGGKEHPLFAHGGSNEGYQCYLVAYDSGDGAVVMTNGDHGGQLAEDIVSTIAFEYKWPDFQPGLYSISKIDPKVFDAYVGTYQLASDFVMTVTRDGDHFMTQATGQGQVEIFPENEHQFFAKIVNAELTFVTDSSGRATELILHQNGADHHAPRKQ